MKRLLQMIIIVSIIFTYLNVGYAESNSKNADSKSTDSTSAAAENAVVAKPNDIDAGAFILIDLKSGQVLFEKDSQKEHMYPASTTKMLTAALACEKGDMNQMMLASKAAVHDIGKDGMNIGISPDEQISLENLLHALLISSANETANIIAENISSTREEFVALMNEKAIELGCEGTHFVNPCGAHNSEHYTTAADLAKIARYSMSFPKFREIVSMISYQLEPTNKHTEWPVLYTTNKLLRYQKSDAPYTITGIKTGYTGQAGNNLVSSAVNAQGMELIAVVMDVTGESSANRVIRYSRELYDYGFSNFSEKQLLQKGEVVQSVSVTDAVDDQSLDLVSDDDFKYVAESNTSDESLTVKPVINTDIKAPVTKGTVLGYMQYEKNGVILGKVNLVASKDVVKKAALFTPFQSTANSTQSSSPVKNIMIIVFSAVISLFLLRFTLKKVSKRLRKKRCRL